MKEFRMSSERNDLLLYEQKDAEADMETTIAALQEQLSATLLREAEKDRQIKNLQEQIDYLTKKLFGAKSEKSKVMPGQIELFNEAEMEQDPRLSEDIFPEETETITYERKRKARKTNLERFKGIPVEKKYLEPSDEDKICPVCGTELTPIGEEFVRRELHYIPAKMTVVEYYSRNYTCENCRDNGEEAYIIKGSEGKSHPLRGLADAATIAWVIYQKYANSMPLYRQAKDWERLYGLEIGTATLANWVIDNTDVFIRQVYDCLHRLLLKRDFLMGDETPVQVLHEKDRRAQTKSYMWVYRSGEDQKDPIVLYHYSETRSGYNAEDFLGKYSGYFMSDGYGGYNKLKYARRCCCWAHVKRYLTDAIPKGMENDYSIPAVQGRLYVDKLFHMEKVIHEAHQDPEEIKEARLSKEREVLDAFFRWLDRQNPVKGSRMEKAVTYIRNRKEYLTVYLEDGRCSFSNNLTEQSCKSFVIGRKNWLFSDRPKGAEASAMLYSIVETAKRNGVNVYYYLRYLLEELPKLVNPGDEELEPYLPWSATAKEAIKALFDQDHRGIAES